MLQAMITSTGGPGVEVPVKTGSRESLLSFARRRKSPSPAPSNLSVTGSM